MQTFKERMFEKMKEAGITSSQFLDNLTEFLCDTDGLTTEEIREDLEAKGVDVDKAIKRTQAVIQKYLRAHKMRELRDAGDSLSTIGSHYGVSRQRVWQILRELKEVGEDAEGREALG